MEQGLPDVPINRDCHRFWVSSPGVPTRSLGTLKCPDLLSFWFLPKFSLSTWHTCTILNVQHARCIGNPTPAHTISVTSRILATRNAVSHFAPHKQLIASLSFFVLYKYPDNSNIYVVHLLCYMILQYDIQFLQFNFCQYRFVHWLQLCAIWFQLILIRLLVAILCNVLKSLLMFLTVWENCLLIF